MLELNSVSKRYGPLIAVDNLSLTINDGQIVGLLGVNGAGKSTTLNMLTGCVAPGAGSVIVDGYDMISNHRDAKRNIGYLPEVVPLVQTFVPGIVGTLAGALIPTVTSLVGGNVGSSLGSGASLKQALKSIDMVAVSGQAIGSMLGSMLGALIPIPVVGTMLGGIVGGIVGEKVFTTVRNWFKKKASKNTSAQIVQSPGKADLEYIKGNMGKTGTYTPKSSTDASAARIAADLDSIPYADMSTDLRSLKDEYEKAYNGYVSAIRDGEITKAQSALEAYKSAKAAYEEALKKLQ